MAGRVWEVLALVLILAATYVMVRPGSKGADMVTAVGSALTAIVRNATDLTGTRE